MSNVQTHFSNIIKSIRKFLIKNIYIAFWISIVACGVVMMVYIAPLGMRIQVGEVASKDLTAPYDIIDEEATETLRKSTKETVEDVYSFDATISKAQDSVVNTFFTHIDDLPENANQLRGEIINASDADSPLRTLKSRDLSADEWKRVLGASGTNELLINFHDLFTEDELYAMLALPEFQYRQWVRNLSSSVQSILRQGVPENDVETIHKSFENEIRPATPLQLKDTVSILGEYLIIPTMFYDEQKTQQAQENALREITTQYITAGEPIVEKGEVISEKQYNILLRLGYNLPWYNYVIRWGIALGAYIVLGLIATGFLKVYGKAIFDNDSRKALLFSLVIIGTLVLSFVLGEWNSGMNMIFFSVLMLTQLVSVPSALLSIFVLMPVLSVMSNGVGVFDYSLVAQSLLVTIVSGTAGVYFARRAKKRLNLLLSTVLSAVSSWIIYALFAILKGQGIRTFSFNAMWLLIGALLCAVLGIGLMPLFETLFDIITPARLTEWSDPGNELLQRIMMEAPGTYHHSMMVSRLAVAAGHQIKANAELLRLAAYYHDVGKLTRPFFFSENQDGENPHDYLEATISADIIKHHVSDGVAMLKQEHFPTQVVDIVQEYHGTALIRAFYGKAIEETGDPDLPKELFSYDGPIPQSKEAAILMIVDALEASVRAMDLKTADEIGAMYDKIVARAWQDGQLNDTPLSIQELNSIRVSVLRVYRGSNHERVQYPDVETLKEELNAHKRNKHG